MGPLKLIRPDGYGDRHLRTVRRAVKAGAAGRRVELLPKPPPRSSHEAGSLIACCLTALPTRATIARWLPWIYGLLRDAEIYSDDLPNA
jgi:hypothetical protein